MRAPVASRLSRSKPHKVLIGLAILILVLAVNTLGEGLRDALDPRMLLGSGASRTTAAQRNAAAVTVASPG